MIKEAIDRILSLAQKPSITLVDGRECILAGNYIPVEPPRPVPLEFTSLMEISNYLRANNDCLEYPLLSVLITSPKTVVLSGPLEDYYRHREVYAHAAAVTSTFPFGKFLDQESFIIHVQTSFIRDANALALLKLAGIVTANELQTNEDDGVTQTTTAKSGVALLKKVELPNPVYLAPYRTFPEIKQPEIPFILRAQKLGQGVALALFDVEDRSWELACKAWIRDWLKKNLPEEVECI